MSIAPVRAAAERKADTLAKLSQVEADVWVATAPGGEELPEDGAGAHLVPLSLAWIDDHVVIALQDRSVTFRNLASSGTARLGLGPTRDVVMLDVVLVDTTQVEGGGELTDRYAAQAGWDPRTAGPGYVLARLRPTRIQAWREENELTGRTLMRAGRWLV